MSMQYLVFFPTAALCLVLIWKNVTGKISYDSSFGAGLGLLIVGMAVQFVFPEYLFLVPLAMIFMMLVPAVWAFDAGSAPVARFADACLAADNPARERNARQLLGILFVMMIVIPIATTVYRAFSGDSVPVAVGFPIILALGFLAVCMTRLGIRVLRFLNEEPEGDGL